MPKTRSEKSDAVETLVADLRNMRSVVFANYEGLTVAEIEELRRTLRKEQVRYMVAKKTLLGRALKEVGSPIDAKTIPGNFATIISFEDEVAPARIVAKYAKDHEVLKVVGGILEQKFIDSKAVLALAALPSKQELLAKLVGSINAPVSGLVNVLAGNLRGLATVLTAIKDAKTI